MLDKLKEIQTREGLTDGQMAQRLHCSRPLWNLVRNGRRVLSDDLAVRAAGAFPELSADLLEMAAESVKSAANRAA